MKCTVVIPWRETTAERGEALAIVRREIGKILPESDMILADSGHQKFNRAASRNIGVRRACESDVLVVCDADTIPYGPSLKASIEEAAKDGKLHYPFAKHLALSKGGTAQFYSGTPLTECEVEHAIPGSLGSVFVINPTVWFRAGGMDERFVGWGFEDTAFAVAVRALVGWEVRHSGAVYHLWHPIDRDENSADFKANEELRKRYTNAQFDASEISLIQGRYSEMHNDYKYATHLPILTEYALKTYGPIIEVGGGRFSTPVLHAICEPHKRILVTVEPNPEWREKLMKFATDWHVVTDSIPESQWDLALIDGPPETRVPAVDALAWRAQYLILHDTEDPIYNYPTDYFPNKREWKWLKPYTMVVSHFQNVKSRDQ